MREILGRGVIRPLVERLGTMFAAYMIARGVDSELAAQMVNGLVAFAAILVDLITSAVFRERDANRLIDQIYAIGEGK